MSVVTVPCPHCDGTGRKPDYRILGAKVRAARKRKKLGFRECARLVGCSAQHLSDMEYGKRGWNGPAAQRALAIVGIGESAKELRQRDPALAERLADIIGAKR